MAITGAAVSRSTPLMMAVLPSSRISAPMRRISSMCMKRFSKIVSMMVPTPFATVLSAANCACMSVGNAGYGAVRMSTACGPAAAHVDLDPGVAHLDRGAGLLQLADDGIEVLRPGVLDADMAAGDGAGDEIGAGLDAIGQHFVGGAVQALDALDDDSVGAGALDLRAHGDQEIGQIDHLRFARGVLEHRLAVGQRRGHHEILGAGDGDGLEHQARALQALGTGLDVAVLDVDVGAHRLQAGDMDVDRTRADRAAAGQRHVGARRSAPAADRAPESTRAWSSPAGRARSTP